MAVLVFALDHQYDADVLSDAWWFRMAEYAALTAWIYVAIFSAAAWVRRAMGRWLGKRRTSSAA